MWTKFKNWCERQSGHYPPRWWWPCVRIYGGAGQHATCYMTRILLGPRTPWGQLYLHIFHREDLDRDPHDHPFPFWTMPLNVDYIEEVMEHASHVVGRQCFKEVTVRRWHISYRAAEHTHRVVRTASGKWPLVTLVWRGTSARKWGFWIRGCKLVPDGTGKLDFVDNVNRNWIPYQQYIGDPSIGNGSSNKLDEFCPGKIAPERLKGDIVQ